MRVDQPAIRVRGNTNVITFNQTVLLVFITMMDSTFFYYFMDDHQELVFTLEMLRTIFIQIISLKFVFPILLLVSSKYHLPHLWIDRPQRKLNFSMTPSTFTAREVVTKYQVEAGGQGEGRAGKLEARKVRFREDVIVTFHADVTRDSMSSVCINEKIQ